jgi:5-methylcytosine-specific restriction protein A
MLRGRISAPYTRPRRDPMPWDRSPAKRAQDAATYGSTEYVRNARTCKKQANGYCQKCGHRTPRLQADHIVPVSYGGTHSLSNLQALCEPCHRAKTAAEGGGWKKPRGSGDPEPRPRTQW